MTSDPVLSSAEGTGPLPGTPAQSDPLLPGGTPAPMPGPAADVVDPSPDEPPVLTDPPGAPEDEPPRSTSG